MASRRIATVISCAVISTSVAEEEALSFGDAVVESAPVPLGEITALRLSFRSGMGSARMMHSNAIIYIAPLTPQASFALRISPR